MYYSYLLKSFEHNLKRFLIIVIALFRLDFILKMLLTNQIKRFFSLPATSISTSLKHPITTPINFFKIYNF